MLPDLHRRTEHVAMDLARRFEASQGRRCVSTESGQYPDDALTQVLVWGSEAGLGCSRSLSSDLVSYDRDGAVERLIEVKGRGGQSTSVSLMDRQLRTAIQLRGHWWLYVAFDCATPNPFLVIVENPAVLKWERLDHERPNPTARPGSVAAEQRWHVAPHEILAAGQRVDTKLDN